jgi:UDP-3-O-[3-hydroxymyristoyl] glucosamine N-acyltransferase
MPFCSSDEGATPEPNKPGRALESVPSQHSENRIASASEADRHSHQIEAGRLRTSQFEFDEACSGLTAPDDREDQPSINTDRKDHDPAITNPFIVNVPYVKPPVYIDYGTNLHIGQNTFVNRNLVVIDSPVCPIWIGARCQLGPNVTLAAIDHPLSEWLRQPADLKRPPLT